MPAGRTRDSVVASPQVRFAPLGDSRAISGEASAEVIGVDLTGVAAGLGDRAGVCGGLASVRACDAMAAAAKETGASIKWGAAWSEGDIRAYKGTAEDAMNAYIDLRRSQSRRPFIDGPHFELIP